MAMNSNFSLIFLVFFFSTSLLLLEAAKTSIVFATLGRSRYNFDIFSVPVPDGAGGVGGAEVQLTDGHSVNYNGFFPSDTSSLCSVLRRYTSPEAAAPPSSALALVYASERGGSSSIYLDLIAEASSSNSRRVALEFQLQTRFQFPLLASDGGGFLDKPSISGDNLIYVSTHAPSSEPRQSWAAVYSTHLPTGKTRRLTPPGLADFSPAVSPSGRWTAVASFTTNKWSGEVQELNTSIYIFLTADGSHRQLLVGHGGWPCWADDNTVYFHRRRADAWWSIYKASFTISNNFEVTVNSVDRITPPGFHAFTPAASPGLPGVLAVATRRPGSNYRHVELIDLNKNAYLEVTIDIAPNAHHYNPFFSPDGKRVAYDRCRGHQGNGNPPLLLENIRNPLEDSVSLFRIDGSFPSFSPDGNQIAYVNFPGLFVMNSDGSGEPKRVFDGDAFATGWDWKRKGVIYTSVGPTFAAESTEVDIISVSLNSNDDDENSEPSVKKLTTNGENNAFPSASPDGKWVVFRSGRSGHKNLYVMDAVEGETAGIYRLTEGPWTDTMCNWSPDGDWIAFASDRHNPGGGSFAIYMIHPNGTGLRKVVHSGDSGRTNHPWFRYDSKKLVFTSDYAGVSAEPIANPHHYQPYGDIFTVNIDGSDIRRLSHNSYEDGTPTWAPIFVEPVDITESLEGSALCSFDDCHWLSSASAARMNDIASGGSC